MCSKQEHELVALKRHNLGTRTCHWTGFNRDPWATMSNEMYQIAWAFLRTLPPFKGPLTLRDFWVQHVAAALEHATYVVSYRIYFHWWMLVVPTGDGSKWIKTDQHDTFLWKIQKTPIRKTSYFWCKKTRKIPCPKSHPWDDPRSISQAPGQRVWPERGSITGWVVDYAYHLHGEFRTV